MKSGHQRGHQIQTLIREVSKERKAFHEEAPALLEGELTTFSVIYGILKVKFFYGLFNGTLRTKSH